MQIRARFRPHPRGFGFLTPVEADGITSATPQHVAPDGATTVVERAFVPPRLARSLVADDLVVADLAMSEKGPAVEHAAVLQRARRILVGAVRRRRGQVHVEPDPHLTAAPIPLAERLADELRRAVDHQVVVLVDALQGGGPTAQALVAGPFSPGSGDAIRADAVVRILGGATPALIAGGASAAGLDAAEAETTHLRLVGQLAGGRRGAASGLDHSGPVPGAGLEPIDRRGTPCVTVDAAGTRDLDDAVGASWNGAPTSPVRVAVHIADASGSVGLGSPADRYARVVAATTYLASGASAPMLDPALSERTLSLQPAEDRRVLSVRFDVTGDGAVADPAIELAVIRSRARVTYATVEQWLHGSPGNLRRLAGDAAEEAEGVLAASVEAARRLGVERQARATFEELFASAEVEPAVLDGEMTVVPTEPHAEAYQLIERLMVAANSTVGEWLVKREVPSLYRVHEGVDPQRLERVRAAAQLADTTLPSLADQPSESQVAEPISPGRTAVVDTDRVIADVLAEVDRLDQEGRAGDRDLLIAAATAASARANYATDPAAHRGLAASAYTHFTSPLRRYADLLVHRQIRATLAGERPPHTASDLGGLAGWLDARAGTLARLQAVERAELWARLLERGWLVGPEPATITAITRAGLTIRLPRLGLTGFVTAQEALAAPPDERARLAITDRGLTTPSGPWRVGSRVQVRFGGLDDTGRPTWVLQAADRAGPAVADGAREE